MDDRELMANLRLFKTAYSPTYKQEVKIKRHFYDAEGEVIIVAFVKGKEVLFRKQELEDFSL